MIEWATYHDAIREWQHTMSVYFDGMSSPDEMVGYMTWRPPPTPPVRGWPGSFSATSATPGALTPCTGGGTPIDGATPQDNPRPVFVKQHPSLVDGFAGRDPRPYTTPLSVTNRR
jgi:hypothetical protein